MQDGTIGRRYARALALSLEETGHADAMGAVEEQLSALAALLGKDGHPDFREAMSNPSFQLDERKRILADIAEANGFHPVAQRLLDLLVDKERIQYLPVIARAFRAEADTRAGRVRANIRSASALAAEDLRVLVGALERRVGKTVLAEVAVDPALIGGVSARIGGQIFDNTVQGQLERIRADLGVA